MVRSWFVVVTVLLAGCAGPAMDLFSADGEYARDLTMPDEPGETFSFTDAQPRFYAHFFNATEGAASYQFRVGDGGRASVCVYEQRALGDALEARYAPILNKAYDAGYPAACVHHAGAGEGRAILGAGAYALAVFTNRCPMQDCSVWLSYELPGERSGGASLLVSSTLGRADGKAVHDPRYPPDPSAGSGSMPVPTAG